MTQEPGMPPDPAPDTQAPSSSAGNASAAPANPTTASSAPSTSPTPSRIPGVVRAVGSVAVLTLVFSGFKLWYESAYVPSTLPPTLSVTVELTPLKAGPEAKAMSDISEFEGLITVKNSGNRRVTVLAAQFNLWGVHLTRRDPTEYASGVVQDQAQCGTAIGGRYVQAAITAPDLLASGRLLDGSWFDPGQEYAERRLFFIKPSDFDLAELTVDLYMAKGDLVTQVEQRPIAWTSHALDGNTSHPCQFDWEGDLTAAPLYRTSWEARNRTLLIGDLVGDSRRLAVEWRSAAYVGHHVSSGADCDVFDSSQTSAADPCWPALRLGATGPGSFVQPMVVYCPSGEDPNTCRIGGTMSLDESLKLADGLGLQITSSTTDLVLWQ